MLRPCVPHIAQQPPNSCKILCCGQFSIKCRSKCRRFSNRQPGNRIRCYNFYVPICRRLGWRVGFHPDFFWRVRLCRTACQQAHVATAHHRFALQFLWLKNSLAKHAKILSCFRNTSCLLRALRVSAGNLFSSWLHAFVRESFPCLLRELRASVTNLLLPSFAPACASHADRFFAILARDSSFFFCLFQRPQARRLRHL